MILLDTNILSELMKPKPNEHVVDWLDEQLKESVFISAITRAEIELGIGLLPEGQRKQKIQAISGNVFAEFTDRCLAFGEMAAVQYGQLVAYRTQKGRPITVEDAQIAAIALVAGLKLVTRNVKDFEEIPELDVINPWEIDSN
jgi:predicted nucleic acid-binding protein